jgi:branched-chain amino acid transport system ATP-binding protein
MSVLEVRELAKSYGAVQALRGISFAVSAGEVVALIGPNGAGKTTCFDLLCGQTAADAGEVRLAGRVVRGLTPPQIWRLGVGRTFQITATFGSMTVLENVQMALLSRQRRLWSLISSAARSARQDARAVLAQVGIVELADRACAELAYGDLKRVELAVALAGAPRLLLMDEPAAGMAPEERAALMRLAVTLSRENGVAVLFSEHDMEVVFTFADRVIVLADGEVLAQGAPASVRADARVREVYLGGVRA